MRHVAARNALTLATHPPVAASQHASKQGEQKKQKQKQKQKKTQRIYLLPVVMIVHRVLHAVLLVYRVLLNL
jgi:cell division protein FtsB